MLGWNRARVGTYYQGRVAVITGAASGIGQALTRELARAGATVILCDSDRQRLEHAERDTSTFGTAVGEWADVTNLESLHQLVSRTTERFGRIDYFFNNAGILRLGSALSLPWATFEDVLRVNLGGTLNGIRAVHPVMQRQRSGHIVNVASLAGLMPLPWAAAYTASKHAVVGLSLSLRPEMARDGVRMTVVCPGFTRTELIAREPYAGCWEKALSRPPFGRLLRPVTPERIATRVLARLPANPTILVEPTAARVCWWLTRLYPWAQWWRVNRVARQLMEEERGQQ